MRRLAGLTSIALLALPLLCWASGAQASCSGGGISWNCTAGTTSAQVGSTLSSATDGATLTFAAGSYSWNSFVSFDNTKGATLICATVGGCNVAASGTVLGMNGNLSGNNSHLYRISGFNFTGGSFMIWFYGAGTMQQVRIDHNKFKVYSDSTAIVFGENYTVANFYGVVDHNTFSSSGSIAAFQYIGAVNPSPPPSPAGTANNLFFEDNTITVTTTTNAGLGCMDGWGGNAVVYRHNTSTNCLVTTHGATHAGGPPSIEFYDNTMIVNSGASGLTDCYRCFHHQGSGEFYAFNNRYTASGGKNSSVLAMGDYRGSVSGPSIDGGSPTCDGTQGIDGNRSPTATYRGYPCWHQPGRDFVTSPVGGNLKPMYIWNNAWSDTGGRVTLSVDPSTDYSGSHIAANRDYYDAIGGTQTSPTSPFNGSTGMGYGTLANRPTTCSIGLTDAADAGKGGVGYFATNQGPGGTLYRCSAANTWAVHYTPYAYPHPLVGGAAVVQAPVITSALTASASVGTSFNYSITATNSPTSFNATGLPAGLSVNTATGVISGTPTAAGTSSVALSATNAIGTGSATLTLTISAAPPPPPPPPSGGSLFLASDIPAVLNDTDTSSVEIGVKFTSSSAGTITGFRFYKGSQNIGAHTAHLWSSSGTLLASATFAGETASGWQQVNLTTPISIAAGTTYIASYHSNGHYSADNDYFSTAHVNAPLTAPSSTSSGGNGVYTYGSSVAFPSSTYGASNYWVDVVFSTAAVTVPVNTAAPLISGTAQVGQTLTVSNGSWSGSPTSFTYQWKMDGAAISGATASTYVPVTADVGKIATASVTATNGAGSSTPASSAATAAIAPAPAAPAITSALSVSGTVGSPFSYTITASNSPTSFSTSCLPIGLTLNTATGVISGTPTMSGASSATIGATNATGTGFATLSVTIN